MVTTAIETGVRWGELIALRPRHLDSLRGLLTVEETNRRSAAAGSPAGQRMIVKPYPKDNEPRTLALRPQLLHALHDHIQAHSLTDGDLLFATRDGNPISRNTFRTRIWAPAVKPDSGPPDTAVHPHVARLRSSPRRSRLFAALPRLWSLPKAAIP